MDSYKTNRLNMIKLDAESSEQAILEGARQTLEAARECVIICEFSEAAQKSAGHTCETLFNAFKELGFKLFKYDADANLLVEEVKAGSYKYENLIVTRNASKWQQRLDQYPMAHNHKWR